MFKKILHGPKCLCHLELVHRAARLWPLALMTLQLAFNSKSPRNPNHQGWDPFLVDLTFPNLFLIPFQVLSRRCSSPRERDIEAERNIKRNHDHQHEILGQKTPQDWGAWSRGQEQSQPGCAPLPSHSFTSTPAVRTSVQTSRPPSTSVPQSSNKGTHRRGLQGGGIKVGMSPRKFGLEKRIVNLGR